ncbi:succinate dehydrogenase cytochrome b subunit [Enemella sp. A6]|uniref:succinate dehydrogenase cytochrome b subunit n=1 Tax=Enemella sp. A6 TaxID=3440152 RepID=UPI003EC13B2E
MAITGVIFVGFVFVHMIGNLKVYQGAEAFNSYAQWLREVGYPLIPHTGVLWTLRVVLVVSLLVHVVAAVLLWLRGRSARGSHRRRRMAGGLMAFGARTMLLGGVIIAAFVVVHLLDLTIGAGVAPETLRHADPDGTMHAYQNLVASFSRPAMAAFYAISMVVLALHIFHGWRTVAQDVGLTGRRLRRVWVTIGAVLAIAVLIGNALIPVLVLAGVIR